ncbi:MAG: hypothetical protein KF833_05390 [Verrucomicrobiae bacterium]|nr:hypothetical protein [Verrucomicrobiae bacterium]
MRTHFLIFVAGIIIGVTASKLSANRFHRVEQPGPAASKPSGSSAQPWTSGGFPDRTGVPSEATSSGEEIEAGIQRIIDEGLVNGEFFLSSEHPGYSASVGASITNIIEHELAVLTDTYSPVFAELGLAAGDAEILIRHMGKIKRAHLNATGALLELGIAQVEYDRRIKERLGEDAYGHYREFEAGRAIHQEIGRVVAFAGDSGVHLQAGDERALEDLLQIGGTFLGMEPTSPYMQTPTVFVGDHEASLMRYRRGIAELVDAIQRIDGVAGDAAWNPEMVQLVRHYFGTELAGRERGLKNSMAIRALEEARGRPLLPDELGAVFESP